MIPQLKGNQETEVVRDLSDFNTNEMPFLYLAFFIVLVLILSFSTPLLVYLANKVVEVIKMKIEESKEIKSKSTEETSQEGRLNKVRQL